MGKFLNAAMTSRLHQQQLMEVLKMNDLPLRAEVDEFTTASTSCVRKLKS